MNLFTKQIINQNKLIAIQNQITQIQMESKRQKYKNTGKSTKQTQKNMRVLKPDTNAAHDSKPYLEAIENQLRQQDDESKLAQIINIELIQQISKVYKKYLSLKQLCARVLLAIYRKTNHRDILIHIKQLILPILLDTFLYINEHLASDLINWAYQNHHLCFQDSLIDQIAVKLKKASKSTFLLTLLKIIGKQMKNKPVRFKNICYFLTLCIKEMEHISPQLDQVLVGIFRVQMTARQHNQNAENPVCLIFDWATLSLNSKCHNKAFFKNLMKISSQILNKDVTSISFISKLILPFGNANIRTNKKLLVLIQYSGLIVQLMQQKGYEDNLTELEVRTVIRGVFKLGQFCDSIKGKLTLQNLICQFPEIPQIKQNESLWNFESCQNIIYRIILCAQKCLPNYQLKYYSEEYIERPDFFHLYFIDEIIKKREGSEVKELFKGLIQKWIKHDLRDFNLLSYFSKFVYFFSKTKHQVKTIISFLREVELQCLICLAEMIHDNSFPDINSGIVSLPITLSSEKQESEIKACGYINKSVFIDRFIPEAYQLVLWEPILQEIIDDNFYFISKYFYCLIYSAFNKHIEPELSSDQIHERTDQLIYEFSRAIKKNNFSRIFSIFQILSCIEKLENEQIQKIGEIVLDQYQKIIKLNDLIQVIWRESLKNKQPSEEAVDNYCKKQKKFKKMHHHFIKSVLRFFEKQGKKVYHAIPKSITYQSAIQIIKKYQQTVFIPHSYGAIRLLSFKSSRNMFQQEAHIFLKESSMNRPKYEILRELIFAYFETEDSDQLESLNKLMPLQKALCLCIQFFLSPINPLYEKDTVTCKIIAFQAIAQCFKPGTNNRQQLKGILYDEKLVTQIKEIIYRVIYKDNLILGKYQRKIILMIRCECLKWLEQFNPAQSIFNTQYVFSLFLVASFDESLQIRIIVLRALTKIMTAYTNENHNSENNNQINPIMYVLSILHVISALDPKIRIRCLANKILVSINSHLSSKPSFVINLCLVSMSLVANLQQWINIPIYDIYLSIVKIWMEHKQMQYLILTGLKQIELKQGILRDLCGYCQISQKDPQRKLEGLKLYYLNPKQKKVWLNGKLAIKEKQIIMSETIKKCIVEKNKNSRFLKSKKQCIFVHDHPQLKHIIEFPN